MSKRRKDEENENSQAKKMIFEDHKYITRRQLLGAGMAPAAAWLVLPGIWGVLSKTSLAQAQALNCPPASTSSTLPAYINIDLSGGGSSLQSNALMTDNTGKVLSNMTAMGMGTNGAGYTATTAFKNNYMFGASNSSSLDPNISNLPQQILAQSKLSNGTNIITNSVMLAAPCQSQDDTSSNDLSCLGMIAATLGNSKLPVLGFQNSSTGVQEQPAYSMAPPAPLFVSSFTTISNALATTGALSKLSTNQQLAVFKMVNDLSGSQANRINTFAGGSNLSNLVQCATGQNVTLVQNGAGNIDPGANTTVAGIWGLKQGTINGPSNNGVNLYTAAAVAYNVLIGNSIAGTIEIPNADYHDNSRSTGSSVDGTTGALVGMILRTASFLGRKVFVDITTCGSTNCGGGSATAGGPWTSDRGTAGCRLMVAYDPAGNVNVNTAGNPASYMIGQFTTGQVADNTFFAGSSPDANALTAFANFCAFAYGTAATVGSSSPVISALGSNAPSGLSTILPTITKIQV